MKQSIKTLVVAFMCLCLVAGIIMIPTTVSAQETTGEIQPRLTYISDYDYSLSISSSGVASVSGGVYGKPGVTFTHVKLILQKNVSGTWQDVKTWEASNNGDSVSIDDTHQLTSRGTYRVYVTFKANTESKICTSSSKTY